MEYREENTVQDDYISIIHVWLDMTLHQVMSIPNPAEPINVTDSVPPVIAIDSASPVKNKVNSKRKSIKLRSEVWLDFEKNVPEVGKSQCIHCKIIYSHVGKNGTSTMKKHLRSCKKKPSNLVADKGQKTLGGCYKNYGNGKGKKAQLGIVEFNRDECRRVLTKMIIKDELSFKFVENEGFREFMAVAQPLFNIPGRITVSRDCMKLYYEEKSNLKLVFSNKSLRVSLTTDTWTSIQNLNYMCVTSHYIDEKWNYNKKILSFSLVPNHKGETIGRHLDKCLQEWGIKKICTVTLDNATSNSVALNYLSKKVTYWNGDLLKAEFLHMRCCVHIVNLIVVEGLKERDVAIHRIREAIKYVKASPARELRFKTCVEDENITRNCSICLDVCTRWNSTYLMLDKAEKFQKAFDNLAGVDEHFSESLDKGKPTSEDWDSARHLCKFLKIFYDATLSFSGSSYVTCNAFFHQFVEILETLQSWSFSNDVQLSNMSVSMRSKFDKYWDGEAKLNYYIFVAVVLDPRYKLGYVEYCFDKLYNFDESEKKLTKLKDTLQRLFDTYSVLHPGVSARNDSNVQSREWASDHFVGSSLATQYKKKLKEKDNIEQKSELDRYLVENVEDEYEEFKILDWWKQNTSKYHVISHIARDILAIPISSVASESAFSTGGRILDPFRSSLNPKTVEALICAQNWLRSSMIDLRKQMDEIESIESEMLEEEGTLEISGTSAMDVEK